MVFLTDNCPSHGKISNLTAIAAEFFPASTTAILQPMDQGIIETAQELYRQAPLRRMLTACDVSKRYNIDLLGAIHLLNISWKELAPSKAANCFDHAGFSRTLVSDPDNDQWTGL